MLGGGGIAEPGCAVLGGGGTDEQDASAVTGGGGITEREASAILGGGGMADPDNDVRGGAGIAEQASAVGGGGGILDPERAGLSAPATPFCPDSIMQYCDAPAAPARLPPPAPFHDHVHFPVVCAQDCSRS